MSNKLILASTSPRRRELLALLNLPFEVVASQADENITGDVAEVVEALAIRKAKAVQAMGSNTQNQQVILAADTLVSIQGIILEKPQNKDHAFEMLKQLQGRDHEVLTGVAILQGEVCHSFVSTTKVFFRPMTDQEIWDYIATGEPFDKAGGYGIQGLGALFVERIEGDFYSVMGLPVSQVYQKLRLFI